MRNALSFALAIAAAFGCATLASAAPERAAVASALAGRAVTPLLSGWRFHFGDTGEAPAQPGFDDDAWQKVSVPHSWNRIGAYGLSREGTDNRQGPGWYRLRVVAPAAATGERQYLDFAAVSKIADVWVNGVHLGEHRGGFGRFRFDVTAVWKPGAANLIAVRADNTKAVPGTPTGETIPLSGDFFVAGGIYRPVALVTVPDASFDLLDHGGPGIYARATVAANAAQVTMLARLRNLGAGPRTLQMLTTIADASGREVARASQPVTLPTGASEASAALSVPSPHLWNGTADPYLYTITATLTDNGRVIDRVAQPLGIRSFRFDPSLGFFLNGRHVKLHGASRHQDVLGKGWALAPEDHERDMAFFREIGANTVRMAHYQHADEWVAAADRAGMVAWAELPYVNGPTLGAGPDTGSPELWANADEQLRELIRQDYNHPAIMMWSVGNEVDASTAFGVTKNPPKPLALLQHLNALAHAEDPSRPTVFADCCEDQGLQTSGEKLAGTTDLIGYNRYFGWYQPNPLQAAAQIAANLDRLHGKHPQLPMSLSEYGAGGAVTQHSDDVRGGFLNFSGRPQPEEFESFVHEQNWPEIAKRDFVFASWAWNMFDFPSDLRNEGDSVDLNTKGLVTADRKVLKDAFYYYKAQWSNNPVLALAGKHYAARAYPVMEVKAYSNAERASLSLNGRRVGEIACPGRICLWPNVALRPGANRVVVTATVGGRALNDEAIWTGPDPRRGLFVDAGDLSGQVVAGKHFGSDTFVTGGRPIVLNLGAFGGRRIMPERKVTAEHPELYDFWREGAAFSYALPVPDGRWTVTIHTFEPRAAPGDVTMRVDANGQTALAPFSVLKSAGGPLRGIARSFPVTVTGGVLKLDFVGQEGNAVVAAIEVTPR